MHLIANNMINGEGPNAFPLRSGTRKGCLSNHSFSEVLEVLTGAISHKEKRERGGSGRKEKKERKEKKWRRGREGKEKKMNEAYRLKQKKKKLFADEIIVYTENPKKSMKQLTKTDN